ncbi:anamorsin homolog [Epargyreus clarus]|uniref:anamorsin homolog n=1 Tax=Epargyreus clarus TaxID=520877 RepID=UPI003C2FFBFC
MLTIGKGDNVLIICNKNEQESLKSLCTDVQKLTNGSIILEESEKITSSSHPVSSFDVVITNPQPPHSVEHTDNLLALIVKVLKPNGKLIARDNKDISLPLKLNGFINVQKNNDDTISAQKPSFEVGSKAVLKLSDKAKLWTIDNNDEDPWYSKDDGELIEQDLLIDQDDLTKPDKQSLRVCATTGKRKACADCSCGLAEELRGETKETPKSSCGSCYLGDAFRCATCPYLGMPAFKPGETVKLDLDSDI